MLSTILAVVSLLNARGVVGAEYKIRDVKDFMGFAVSVNTGKTFKGTTVLLENDVVFTDELSAQFRPIGINGTCQFNGIFDGQGYKISNLKMKFNNQKVGVFGFSNMLTIRNVVIDDSCSFTSSFSYALSHYVGSLLSYCYANGGNCILENNVNMAPVTFDGYNTLYVADVFVGGIVGNFLSYAFCSMTNCANYGTVTHSGTSDITYMGGLAGRAFEYYGSSTLPIKNSVNYGDVIHSGTTTVTTWMFVGGLTGYSQLCNIENCANFGIVEAPAGGNRPGNLVGNFRYSTASHSYWNGKNSCGAYGSASNQTTVECAKFDENSYKLEKAVTVGKYNGYSLLDALNAYVDDNPKMSYPHWATNKGGNAVTFTVNGVKRFALNAKLIVLPNLAKEKKKAFSGWYTDSACKNLLKEYEISSDKFLYGTFK